MVAFAKTAFAAITLFTSLVSADCAFNILNINGAVMGTGCARFNGRGTLTLPDYGPATFTVAATGSCGLSIVSRQSRFPASQFNGWTVGSAGSCTVGSGSGGGSGGGTGGGGGVVAPPVGGGVPVIPPGGNTGGKSGKSNPRKCDRERCSGPQGVSKFCFWTAIPPPPRIMN